MGGSVSENKNEEQRILILSHIFLIHGNHSLVLSKGHNLSCLYNVHAFGNMEHLGVS